MGLKTLIKKPIYIRLKMSTHISTVSHKFCPWFWQFIMSSNHRNNLKNLNIEMRNNIEMRIFKFLNKKPHDTTISRFGYWYFCHLYLFRVSIFEFRIFPSPTDGWNIWIYMNISCCHFKALNFWDGALVMSVDCCQLSVEVNGKTKDA